MTDDSIALRGLLEKSSDADLLREMIGGASPRAGTADPGAAERLMALEVQALTGAGYGERTAERLAQRNGYRDRVWRPAPAPSSYVSPSSGKAATSRAFWSRGGWRRRPSPR